MNERLYKLMIAHVAKGGARARKELQAKTGISHASLSGWISRRRKISSDNAFQLAMALGCTEDEAQEIAQETLLATTGKASA
jgi:hypothetical protein